MIHLFRKKCNAINRPNSFNTEFDASIKISSLTVRKCKKACVGLCLHQYFYCAKELANPKCLVGSELNRPLIFAARNLSV